LIKHGIKPKTSTTAQTVYFADAKDRVEIPTGSTGMPNARGLGKIGDI